MSEFVRLTSREVGGGDLFLKRSMVAAVGSYWNGKQQVTHVTLINEDVDYEVKESPAEVLRLLEWNGQCPEKNPNGSLTNQHPYGIMRRTRRNQHGSKTRSESQTVSPERRDQVPPTV
jgi:hypothetical protein